ncbi:MAG: thiamine pyrophosphate-binding protein, partial [Nitrospinaceae bacterium]|nr:thiamine pyrophosphate-binding protein [Nitrospinaceae bacterium]
MSGNEELIHAGKAIADALVRENVKKVFCLPGSHVLQIYDGLRQAPSIQLVTCKMEPNISLMADAYGRISGEPGVGLTTAGPGAINSLAGVAQAYGAASPMVHLTGSVPLNASREAFHGVDNPEFTVDMFRHATKWSVRLERLEDIPAVMAKAFHIARSGRPGPVHVEFPRATDYAPFILQPERVSYPVSSSQPAEVVEPTREDVEQVAQRILDAKLPVFCAGKGVIRKGAMEELAKLSEMFSIPVVYPQDAMGVIRDDHPFAAGHYAPARQDPRFKYVMEDADLIVSIGLRADTAEVDHLEAFGPSDRILVGFDNAEDEHYSKKDEFVADPKLFMTLLLERMSKESRPPNEELKSEIARIRTEYRTAVRAHLDGSRDNVPVHPGFIIESIADWVGPDDVVVSDVGNSQMWSRYYIPIHHHESLMQSGVWNAMSFCL